MTGKNSHIAVRHLRQTIHACQLCPFTSLQLGSGEMAKHVRQRHGGRCLGPDTVRSEADKFASVIKRMARSYFD